MSEVAQELPALLGVVIGALATYLATAAAERARWRRDQAVRWDAKRMEAYADYGRAVKRLTDLAMRIAVARGATITNFTGREPLEPTEGLPALAQAEIERGSIWESVLMLGSPEVVSAARRWHEAVWRLDSLARNNQSQTSEWDEAFRVAGSARADFYLSVRMDLGVLKPDLPHSSLSGRWSHPSAPTDGAAGYPPPADDPT
jgi:hypothetical protein